MAKVRVLIVEDELLVAEEMAESLKSKGYMVQDTVESASEARRALQMYEIDIVLIDIQLVGDEDGIELALYINETYALPIIFVTSFMGQDMVKRALQARPSAYLVKPFNPVELQISIDVALSNYENGRPARRGDRPNDKPGYHTFNQSVFVRDKNRLERVNYDDIQWLKAESSYVEVATKEKKYLLTTDTLGSMLQKSNYDFLIRVHRSYAVNVNSVSAVEGNQLAVANEMIPIGKNYRPTLKKYFHTL